LRHFAQSGFCFGMGDIHERSLMQNIKTLILMPLLLLACTLTAQVTPPPHAQDGRGAMVATVKPTEQTASPTPAPQVCQVKTGIDAGALNLRTCGALACPVVIVLHEGEALTRTKPQTVDGWLAVVTTEGGRGWVNSNYVTCEVTK
jgi:uncharacterized protein YgiM (DUF1202 family)